MILGIIQEMCKTNMADANTGSAQLPGLFLRLGGVVYTGTKLRYSIQESVIWFFFVGFEVLTAVVMKSSIFWDITSCSPLKVNRCFGESCSLHLQGRGMSRARNQRETRWQASDMFLRNVGWLLMGNRVWYPQLCWSHWWHKGARGSEGWLR
jgi:hypothetical protein